MANRRMETVGYRPFRAQPLLAEGLLAVDRPGGETLERVSAGLFRLAAQAGQIADEQVRYRYGQAGEKAGVAGAPDIGVEGGGSGQPYKTTDPVATDLPTEARALLNAIAAGESGGKYNIRYTPQGGATFSDLTRHPGIFEPGPHGKSSAAGRYQFTKTTWDRMGGGDFSPANQDRRAWELAQADYKARTGRPLLADLRQNGLTGDMIASLSPTWAAFNHNRSRHAATYLDSLERISGSPDALPAPARAQDLSFTVSGGGFRPMAGDTLAARAYNEAGSRSYLQMLNTELLSTTSQVYDLYRDDPVALEKALGVLKSELAKDHVFDEIAADFEVSYGRLAEGYLKQSRARLLDRQEAEDRAAFIERTDALSTDIARRIEGMDPDSPGAADLLAATQAELDGHYDAAVDRGLMAPDAAATAKAKARSATAVSFYARQARERSSEEIAALRETMRADFAAGALDGVDADGWAQLEAELARLEQIKQREEATATAELAERAQKQIQRVEAGFDPDPEEINRLKLDAGTTPDGDRIAETSQKIIETSKMLRDLPLPAARSHVEELRKRTGKNASDEDIAVLAYAEKRLAELETLAAKDPVGYEIATGRLELTPIALEGDDEALAASLRSRRIEMAPVAETYGRPLEILRPHERTALARMMAEDPAQMPRLARAMREALGADAATALAEIAPEAPALAHAAGVSIATGDDGFMDEIAQALAAKAKGEFKLKMPAEEKFAVAAGPEFSRALSFLGATRTAALQTAQLIYEREANLLGFDPAELGKDDAAATAAWRRALNRALGARIEGGRQTGGLTQVNGEPIVAPAGMDVDMPQRLVSGLTDSQLERLPPIRTANGVPVSAAQIRRGFLSSAGDGRYRVSLGDPLGFEPRWVLGQDGDFWTLDLKQLEDIRGTRDANRELFENASP